MKGTIIAVGTTAILGIAVNIVSDNLTNPWAWVIFVIAVLLAIFAGNTLDRKRIQRAKVRGESNDVEQNLSGAGTQTVDVKGKENKIKQTIKNENEKK